MPGPDTPNRGYTTVDLDDSPADIETALNVPLGEIDADVESIAVQLDALPTDAEAAALAGTSGAPSDTNRYVTDADPRLDDERVPPDGSVTPAKMAARTSYYGEVGTGTLADLGYDAAWQDLVDDTGAPVQFTINVGATDEVWDFEGIARIRGNSGNESAAVLELYRTQGPSTIAHANVSRMLNTVVGQSFSVPLRRRLTLPAGQTWTVRMRVTRDGPFGGFISREPTMTNFGARRVDRP
jgi:hypothetical protein